MRKRHFFRLFSLSFLSLAFCSTLAFSPCSAQAENENDLRENIQKNLPEGEEIKSFLQLSPNQAWITTAYSHSDSIKTVACTLSFIKMDMEESSPKIANSLTLLSNQQANTIRAFDSSWTLPIAAEGGMTLKNVALNQNFNMVSETSSTIGGTIDTIDLKQLLSGIARGQEVWMSFSLGEPQSLPTARIIPLINDFKHCTSENHFAYLGGPLDPRANLSDNPF